MKTNAHELLERIILMDIETEKLQDSLLSMQRDEVLEAVNTVFADALKQTDPSDAPDAHLIRALNILLFLGGEDGIQCMIQGLNNPNPDVRLVSGEAVLDVATEDFSALKPAVETALGEQKKSTMMLQEMPFILAEIDDVRSLDLLHRFLLLNDPVSVAAAIEALAEVGDMNSVKELMNLKDDAREIRVDDEEDEKITIGQMATEAIGIISEQEGS